MGRRRESVLDSGYDEWVDDVLAEAVLTVRLSIAVVRRLGRRLMSLRR